VRFLFRNLHIFVFAATCVFAAVFVSGSPDRAVDLMRPVVEDAVELKELAQGAYREVRNIGWIAAADDAVTLFTASLRMPTRLFEELADRIGKAEREMKRARRNGTAPGSPKV